MTKNSRLWLRLAVLLMGLWATYWLWTFFTFEGRVSVTDYFELAAILSFPPGVCAAIYIAVRATRSGWGRLGLVAWALYVVLVVPLLVNRSLARIGDWNWSTDHFASYLVGWALYLPVACVFVARWVLRGFHRTP